MRKSVDWWLVGSIVVLQMIGLLILYSVNRSLVLVQGLFFVVGAFIFILMMFTDSKILSILAKIGYFFSIGFLILPYIIGEITRGTFRWIDIGFASIQPSEIVKPLLIIGLAKFFSTRLLRNFRELIISVLLVALPVVIVFFQPDLGSALVIGIGWLSVVVATGIPLRYLVLSAVSAVISFPLMWNILKDYQKNRLMFFMDPTRDPLGAGYNVLQAIIAVGSGQLLGRGLGRGSQSHLRFLPENHTDFMFASLSEELGLIGITIVLICFGIILYRMVKIASRSSSMFERLTVYGIAGMFFFQIIENIGMNLGILPVTGIPLPLISYGGSSLVSTLFGLGIIQSIALRQNTDSSMRIQ